MKEVFKYKKSYLFISELSHITTRIAILYGGRDGIVKYYDYNYKLCPNYKSVPCIVLPKYSLTTGVFIKKKC